MKKLVTLMCGLVLAFTLMSGGLMAADITTEDACQAAINAVEGIDTTALTPSSDGTEAAASQTATLSAFSDIVGHWAEKDINYAVGQKLFNGVSATSFAPDTSMTRGMFITVLGRYAGVADKAPASTGFGDVATDHYCAPYVAWAVEKGVTKGMGNGNFGVDNNISRQDLATMLVRYFESADLKYKAVSQPYNFADQSRIADYAADAVSQMQQAGYIGGKNNNLFDPSGLATRAEVATIFARFIKAQGGEDIVLLYPYTGVPTYTSVTGRFVLGTGFSDDPDNLAEGFIPEGDAFYYGCENAADAQTERTAYLNYLKAQGYIFVETQAEDGLTVDIYEKGQSVVGIGYGLVVEGVSIVIVVPQ